MSGSRTGSVAWCVALLGGARAAPQRPSRRVPKHASATDRPRNPASRSPGTTGGVAIHAPPVTARTPVGGNPSGDPAFPLPTFRQETDMADSQEKDAALEARFWASLRKDMTVMLGLGSEIEYRPMTAQLLDDRDEGPIWFFGITDSDLVRHLEGGSKEASFHFVSKDHDLWATVSGMLQVDNNRAVIDKLWNSYAATWYEQGKDDPKLALLRMDPTHAKIWKSGSSLVAYALTLLGRDPKKDYQDNVASVPLR